MKTGKVILLYKKKLALNKSLLFNKDIKFTFLFCLVYFTSYITRVNYGAALIDISDKLDVSDSLAGIPVSLSFISYGVGQLVAGYLGDKLNSVKIVTSGLILTATMNIFVSFSSSIYLIMVFWAINGFAQSLLWPPLVKIMLSVFSVEQYKKSCAFVIMASSVATIITYIIVPICISNFSYKLVFIGSAALAAIVVVIWTFNTKDIVLTDIVVQNPTSEKISILNMISSLKLIPIMIIIVLQGMLREGVTLWMPAFLSDNFNQSDSISIFTTTLLPIFSIATVAITRVISKKINSEITLSAYLWLVSLISGIALFVGMDNIVISVITLTSITSCMHAINLLLIANLPAKFVKYGKISTISGVLNSCTYLGSTISTYAIAKIVEVVGWSGNVISWMIIAFLGLGLCLFTQRQKRDI